MENWAKWELHGIATYEQINSCLDRRCFQLSPLPSSEQTSLPRSSDSLRTKTSIAMENGLFAHDLLLQHIQRRELSKKLCWPFWYS